MIEPVATPMSGIFCVVTSDQLENHTRNGWQLVRVVEDETPMANWDAVREQERALHAAVYNNPTNNYYQSHASNASRGNGHDPNSVAPLALLAPVVVKVTRYLLVKSEESELGRLQQELRTSEGAKYRAERDLGDAKKEAEKVDAEVKKLQGSIGVFERNEATHRSNVNDRELRIRKMEGDLALVRQAVGAIKMKEILGDGK